MRLLSFALALFMLTGASSLLSGCKGKDDRYPSGPVVTDPTVGPGGSKRPPAVQPAPAPAPR
jgi:hypothetical protein